jgi:hypothetical protein
MVAAIRFTPVRIPLEALGSGESAGADFIVWSATRADDEWNLQWVDPKDPRFVYESKRFTVAERQELEKKLRRPSGPDKEGENTHVRAAYHFQVTVREHAGGKQLDQGPFRHEVTFLLDDEPIHGPQILGKAKDGIVDSSNGGKVDLDTFRAKEGVERTVSLWTDEKIILKTESQIPATLDVEIKGEKAGPRTKWLLKVKVPPSSQFGVFPEDSVIILRIQTTPPRFIRIPVTGNGQF